MSGINEDFKNTLAPANGANSIPPQVATSTVTGAGVDCDGRHDCFAQLHVGTVSGPSPTLDVKLQESDTSGGTYADITGATFVQITASSKLSLINFKRSKRWVRALGTIGGASPSFAFGVAIHGKLRVF